MAWSRGWLLVLGLCMKLAQSASPFDEFVLIQKGAQEPAKEPEHEALQTKNTVPPTMLASARRQSMITRIRDEMGKYLDEDAIAGQLSSRDMPTSLPTLDAATMMEMLPSLMDSLRDDNFVRSFIEFEDGVEQASKNFVRLARAHMRSLMWTGKSSKVALVRAESTAALRLSIARFLDHWVSKVLTSYPEELVQHAERFAEQVGNEHQLSKGFSDLFVPLFKNMSLKISTRMIPGSKSNATGGKMTFESTLSNDTEANFCKMVGEIVKNATVATADSQKVLKILNNSRRMALPLIGKYMADTLPTDADAADKEVPSRMMLVMDYEVSMIYSMMDAFRQNMEDYSAGLKPILTQELACTVESAAPPRRGMWLVAAAVLAALVAL